MQFFVGVYPLPIQIDLSQIASIVSYHNPVDVKHGYDFE